MLKKIKFKGGFFSEETELELFLCADRMSLIYEKNGSGKSTISKAIRKAKGEDIEDISQAVLYDQDSNMFTDTECIHVFNSCRELKNKEIILFSLTKRNEYSEILKSVYDYACGADENDDLIIGNSMRRVLEAFSTFVYKKGTVEISCDDSILQQLGDKDYIKYFKNLMYRLVLNGDSHMEERTNSMEDMDYLEFLSDDERRRTAREVICFIYLLCPTHILAHLERKANVGTNIQRWCLDIKNFFTTDDAISVRGMK